MTNKKVDKKASKELVTNIYKLHKTIDESRDYIDKCKVLKMSSDISIVVSFRDNWMIENGYDACTDLNI